MGPTVIAELDGGPTVMLTSRRVAPFSLQQLTSCNIDPNQFQIIVAKGVHAPVAAYAPVCRSLLRVNTPGVTTADMTRLDLPQPPQAAVSVRGNLKGPGGGDQGPGVRRYEGNARVVSSATRPLQARV